MSDETNGQENFQFARWETPFENQTVELLEIAYTPVVAWSKDLSQTTRNRSTISLDKDAALTMRLEHVVGAVSSIFRVRFDWLDAYRVVDEGTLGNLWTAKHAWPDKLGLSTFRVLAKQLSPHYWSGTVYKARWAYFIATQDDCVEIITGCDPVVELE